MFALSERIQTRLEETELFRRASCVALYNAIAGEVQTSCLLEKWCDEKHLLLPRVVGSDLCFSPYCGADTLRRGAFGIMEPDIDTSVAMTDIDLIVVPGIAFDRRLNRLGRGGGYYDRLLSMAEVPAVGLCFDFQLFEAIPTEPFDKKMDMIVTEKEVVIG